MKKSIILLILILSLVVNCGCEAVVENQLLGAYSEADDTEIKTERELTDVNLLYYPDMDVNPVTTTCLANNQLLKLVYQPLVQLNADFKPTGVIADSFEQSGATVTVKLKSGLKFSNGEPVTAFHAVKSFNVAKKNAASPYNSNISYIKEYYAKDDLTFVCVFKTALADAAGLLDIPVMYNGEAGIGSGPYRFETKSAKLMLVKNDHFSPSPKLEKLYLKETKKDEYITSLFSAGELDVVSIPANDDLTLTSLRDYSIVNYPSNNLIYIGVNASSEVFADANIRRAISDCIDRKHIANQALVGLASPSLYPVNPSWYKLSVYNIDAAPEKDEAEVFAARDKLKEVKLTLLIPDNSDVKTAVANALVERFRALGLTLELKISENYANEVALGAFDLYLGETAIPRTMDSGYLFTTGGSVNYGGFSNAELDSAYASFTAGEIGLDKYLQEFSKQMPIIPVVFRKNVIYCAGSIEGWSGQSAWNSYGNFETIYIKKPQS